MKKRILCPCWSLSWSGVIRLVSSFLWNLSRHVRRGKLWSLWSLIRSFLELCRILFVFFLVLAKVVFRLDNEDSCERLKEKVVHWTFADISLMWSCWWVFRLEIFRGFCPQGEMQENRTNAFKTLPLTVYGGLPESKCLNQILVKLLSPSLQSQSAISWSCIGFNRRYQS